MRRITFWFLGILGTLFVAALVIPFFITINDFKPIILAKTKDALEREVRINGNLSLSLLPSPHITINQIHIGNLPNGSKRDFLIVKNLRLSIAFLPLLKKHVKLTSIEFDQPDIFLEKLEDGQTNWAFPPPSQEPSTNFEVAVSKISLTGGHLTYHAGQQNIEIQNIHTQATLDAPYHPSDITATFKVFNEDIKVEGKSSGPTDLTDILLSIKSGPITSTLKGQLSLAELSFKGHLNGEADPKILKNCLPSIQELPLFTQPWKVNADVLAHKNGVMLRQFKLQIGSASPKGDINIVLKDALRIEAALQDLPGSGTCTFTFSLTPQGLSGQIDTTIPHTIDLLRWLGTDVTAIPSALKETLAFSAQYTIGEKIFLKDLTLLLGNAKLQGSISWKMQESNLALAVDLESSKVENIVKILGDQAVTIMGPGRFRGTIVGDMMKLNLDTAFSLGDLTLKTQGTASSWLKTPELDLQVNLFHPNLQKFLGSAGGAPLSAVKKVSIDSHLHGKPTLFKLANLKGNLGSDIQFSGNAAVDCRSVKPDIQAALSFNSFNLDTLLAAQKVIYPSYTFDSNHGRVYLVAARRHSKPSTSSVFRWSHEPLDLSFLRKFDGQFDITFQQFRQHDFHISHPKLSAKVHNGRLNLTSLVGSVFGGELTAQGYITADNATQAHIALKGAHLENLWTQEGRIKIVHGKLSLSSDLTTHGRSIYEMIHHLTGPLTIQAQEGMISGFNLPAISQGLSNLKSLGSLLALLNTGMGKGQTPFSSFDGNILFKEGIGLIQSMKLIAQGGQGQATGLFNLPSYTLDILSEFHLTDHPKLPPFRMHLSGAIDQPSRQLDTSNLQKYMMENVFQGVIQQLSKGKIKAGDILGSLLEGDNGSSPQPNKSAPAPQKPEQIVKDIFKGLF